MNTKGLVKKVHKRAFRLTKDEVKTLVGIMFEIIAGELIVGGDVNIRGFGHFYIEQQREKIIHHPRTHARIVAKPKLLKFRPSKNLKAIVKGKKKPIASPALKQEVS